MYVSSVPSSASRRYRCRVPASNHQIGASKAASAWQAWQQGVSKGSRSVLACPRLCHLAFCDIIRERSRLPQRNVSASEDLCETALILKAAAEARAWVFQRCVGARAADAAATIRGDGAHQKKLERQGERKNMSSRRCETR
ncbi:hypothetical protein CKAH01_12525 [Colletotrichum kahawae]|uniref:Uncharacterized protein n=1 Tax=Colletotrichum kahawae TaxID=34407 RepID=A0AAD9YT94_COLKA|nr:hypothetical protein CKAH01_12525 [Colletotrichum kahawae]